VPEALRHLAELLSGVRDADPFRQYSRASPVCPEAVPRFSVLSLQAVFQTIAAGIILHPSGAVGGIILRLLSNYVSFPYFEKMAGICIIIY
jgi:hypothetical protein